LLSKVPDLGRDEFVIACGEMCDNGEIYDNGAFVNLRQMTNY